MIEKNVHYCRFGDGNKPKKVIKLIDSWKKLLPDYNFYEWNNSNCDIYSAPKFVKEAYAKKKWAFVSDYFRLKALYEFGGVYFDTDVELLKNIDDLMTNNDFFCCFESKNTICTAVIGASKRNKIIFNILSYYSDLKFDLKPNSFIFYSKLIGDNKVINIYETYVISDKEHIYPCYYFSPISYYTGKILKTKESYAIHHFAGTWKSNKNKVFDNMKRILYKCIGEENYFKLKKFFKRNKYD